MTVEEAYIAADRLARLLTNLKYDLAYARFDQKRSDAEKMEFLAKRLAETIEDISEVRNKVFGVNGNEKQTSLAPRIFL